MTALKLTAPAAPTTTKVLPPPASTARRARFDWETICAEYEAGQTVSALARQFGCSRGAIQKHIEAGQWTQNLVGHLPLG
jgi:hypothetical protein